VSLDTQVSLLRAIEKKCVYPLGASQEVPVDVRFITATNRDLEADVEAGRFRRDLFYRISDLTIRLPPLRDRLGDIPQLVAHFVQDTVGESASLPAFSADAIGKLSAYHWPGNVRELRAEVTRAVRRCRGEEITAADCLVNARPRPVNDAQDYSLPLEAAQDQFTTAYLRHWLEKVGGNASELARHAGMHVQSVRRLLRKHHLRDEFPD
jgi:DNA-binding NtrC family response regulator